MSWRLHDIIPFRANTMQLVTASYIQPRNALCQLLHNSLLIFIRLRWLRHNKFSLKTHGSTVLPRQIQRECVFPMLQITSQNYALTSQLIAFVVVASPLDPYLQVYFTGEQMIGVSNVYKAHKEIIMLYLATTLCVHFMRFAGYCGTLEEKNRPLSLPYTVLIYVNIHIHFLVINRCRTKWKIWTPPSRKGRWVQPIWITMIMYSLWRQ